MAISLMAGSSGAQRLQGVAEVEYRKWGQGGPSDLERWRTSFRVEYSAPLSKTVAFSSLLQYDEQKYIGRPDRQQIPQGSLRLSHPLFGLYAAYRPTLITDARNFTTEQQELTLVGSVQKANLPQVSGSWIRQHQDANSRFPGAVAVKRSLSSNYDVGLLNFRAGYFDQANHEGPLQRNWTDQNSFTAGSSARFERRGSNALLQYDFNRSLSRPAAGLPTQTSRVHSAGLTGSTQFSSRTSASLNYNFRHTGTSGAGTTSIAEHDGTLGLAHRFSKAFQASAGGGARSVNAGDRKEIEKFLNGSIAAGGEARPGWHVGANASHAWNWLPGEKVRPVDSFRSDTRMRLAEGLDAYGDVGLTKTHHPEARADTVANVSQVVLQSTAGIRATPLPRITLDASMRRFRTGAALRGGGHATSTSYSTRLNWRVSSTLQMNGSWNRSGGFDARSPDRTTEQAGVQWTPNRAFKGAATYTRTNQEVRDPNSALSASRENFGAWVTMGLTRDLRATIRYSESDPGLSTRARQVSATLTQNLWR